MNAAHHSYRATQRGMALVIVLWIIVLLSVIAAAHARNVHTTTRLTARQLEVAQLRAAANAGVQRAILELLAAGNPAPWPINGDVRTMEFAGDRVSVAIRSASGLVDLNSATPQLIASLVRIIDADADEQAALADAILDWRDEDDFSHLRGAENSDYRLHQSEWSIRNGAFIAVEELRYVRGMTNQHFRKIAPLVTVHSGYAGINMEYAAATLIELLVGEQINTLERPPSARSQSATATVAARAGTFRINSEAFSATNFAGVQAMVRITPGTVQPYTVLSWREPGRTLSDVTQ